MENLNQNPFNSEQNLNIHLILYDLNLIFAR